MSIQDFDKEFEDAFEEAVAKEMNLDDKDSRGMPGPAKETSAAADSAEDSSTDSESSEKRTEEGSEESSADDSEQNKSTDTNNDIDAKYEALSNQYKLATSRLNDLSQQYQMTKGELKALKEMAQDKEKSMSRPEFKEPDAFKTLREDWPDVAEAVEAMLAAKLEYQGKMIEDVVSSKVAPIEQNVSMHARNSHLEKISRAHPDVYDIVSSGELDAWQESLRPVERRGVQVVRDSGSAEEVIEMLSWYKESKGSSKTNKTQTSSKPEPKAAANEGLNYDDLVEKIKAAIVVPSSKSVPKTTSGQPKAAPVDDFDAAFDEATKND